MKMINLKSMSIGLSALAVSALVSCVPVSRTGLESRVESYDVVKPSGIIIKNEEYNQSEMPESKDKKLNDDKVLSVPYSISQDKNPFVDSGFTKNSNPGIAPNPGDLTPGPGFIVNPTPNPNPPNVIQINPYDFDTGSDSGIDEGIGIPIYPDLDDVKEENNIQYKGDFNSGGYKKVLDDLVYPIIDKNDYKFEMNGSGSLKGLMIKSEGKINISDRFIGNVPVIKTRGDFLIDYKDTGFMMMYEDKDSGIVHCTKEGISTPAFRLIPKDMDSDDLEYAHESFFVDNYGKVYHVASGMLGVGNGGVRNSHYVIREDERAAIYSPTKSFSEFKGKERFWNKFNEFQQERFRNADLHQLNRSIR